MFWSIADRTGSLAGRNDDIYKLYTTPGVNPQLLGDISGAGHQHCGVRREWHDGRIGPCEYYEVLGLVG